jgi:hypothetical protein
VVRLLALLLWLTAPWVAVACGGAVADPAEARFVGPAPPTKEVLALPNGPGSIKFAAIGDAGRGDRPQYEVSAQMQAFRKIFDYDFVVMLGDNVYDGGTLEDYRQKFELPYKPLLDEGVEFYATIGNHDDAGQPFYEPFNMNGRRFYTFKADRSLLAKLTDTDVEFFMIDTETIDRAQVAWLDSVMRRSTARWKIPVFHRPIYTSGRYGVPARIFPGGAGSLRERDIRRNALVAAGFDIDYHFMLFEVTRDRLFYQAISRTGHSVDAGVIAR